MNKSLTTIALLAGLALPMAAEARPLTLTTTLNNYGGNGAYLAIYLTDTQGKVHSTLRVAAPKAKYHSHLRDWSRGAPAARRPIDGVTGASVGSGQTLKVSVDIADALIDAGFQIRIDSAVENGRDNPSEIVAPLTKGAAATPIAGKGYVKSFRFDM
jgi:hypothetical protein